MSHTPGEWYVNGDTYDVERMDGTCGNTKRIVARCSTGSDAMANACLISAAPDMLEACKGLLNCFGLVMTDGEMKAVWAARDAISKAEGKRDE